MRSKTLKKVTLLSLATAAGVSAAIALPYLVGRPSDQGEVATAYGIHRWALVITDMFISASYAAICAGLAWTIGKLRAVPLLNMHLRAFRVFSVFLILCSATRFSEALTAWWPIDRFSLALKTLCALISIPAATLLVWKLPEVVHSVCGLTELLAASHQQTEELRKSQAFLDRAGQIAGIGGWEVDLITDNVTWSAETCRIHGAPVDFAPTLQDGLEFYAAESRPIITAAVELACTTGEGWDLELSVIRVDGRQIWVRCSGTAEMRGDRPIRLAGAFQDITGRVAERDAYKQAKDLVTLATDSGRIGIWDWDIVRDVLTCDAWMHRLHGIDSEDGQPDSLRWREHLHPDDKERVVKTMFAAIDGSMAYDTEFRVVWPDGSIRNLRATAQVTRDADGEGASDGWSELGRDRGAPVDCRAGGAAQATAWDFRINW